MRKCADRRLERLGIAGLTVLMKKSISLYMLICLLYSISYSGSNSVFMTLCGYKIIQRQFLEILNWANSNSSLAFFVCVTRQSLALLLFWDSIRANTDSKVVWKKTMCSCKTSLSTVQQGHLGHGNRWF